MDSILIIWMNQHELNKTTLEVEMRFLMTNTVLMEVIRITVLVKDLLMERLSDLTIFMTIGKLNMFQVAKGDKTRIRVNLLERVIHSNKMRNRSKNSQKQS